MMMHKGTKITLCAGSEDMSSNKLRNEPRVRSHVVSADGNDKDVMQSMQITSSTVCTHY